MDLQQYNDDERKEFIEKFSKRWDEKEIFIKSIFTDSSEYDEYNENPNYLMICGIIMGEKIRKYIRDIYKISNENDTKDVKISRLNELFDYVLKGKNSNLAKCLDNHCWC